MQQSRIWERGQAIGWPCLKIRTTRNRWILEAQREEKIIMERKTEDRVAAQRGETQDLRAHRTSTRQENKSKLGNRGLRKERLVALSQGRKELILRSHRGRSQGQPWVPLSKDQAWTWTEGSEHISEGTEEVHDQKQMRRGGPIWGFWKRMDGGVGSALERHSSTAVRCGGTARQCMGGNVIGQFVSAKKRNG